ncbi:MULTISPECIES: phosphoribosylformylglycinamidine cyclo-ligase [Clostridium]|jgi:phosphoribosylformylglycinamidine cyclo-ligase|uniref:phosphoribosylformylglycinamidine cyclo-ligase n=1 Tax=Clostridium TaxID=1485 RepID=UPI00028929D6|nr:MULTISPECIES: phosphoribosylformylglycinamidine cyclo-ligase [Clostridium]MDF2503904.1 phosphoribosylaminoimidazole synthetase [Clostridium sp.]
MVTYKDAGVNIEEGYETVSKIKNYAKKTYTKDVLNNLGSFAGMFALGNYKNPVLVSGTDGVGTKLAIAFKMKKYDTVGIDCVAMCVNDILCHGAKPLFFLDYMACGKLAAETASQIVKGVSEGCMQAASALIGGETAEMPGFYKDGDYDLAGFSVGIVEKDEIIDGSKIEDKDVLIGIASSGVHSNGFSLVRKLVPDIDIDFNGKKIGEVLLEPTKIYVKPILKLMEKFEIRGMAHITGGGFYENIPRMFKGDFASIINKDSYELPEIFKYLMSLGVKEDDMYNTFNMGIGFVLCVKKEDKDKIIEALKEDGEEAFEIGHVEAGGKGVCIK